MDGRIVSIKDMTRAAALDARLELLLAGVPPAEDALDEDLTALITQMNALVPAPAIAPDMANAHIAMIVETAATLGPRTVPQALSPRLGWRARLSSLSATPARKIAAATLSVSATFSGMAYAGVLPDPLQRTAADIARMVGVNLPHPDDITSDDRGLGGTKGPQSESESNDPAADDNGKPVEGSGGPIDDGGRGSGDDPSAEGENRDSEGDEPSAGDHGEASDDSGSDDGSGMDDEGSGDKGLGSDSDDEDAADPNDPPEADEPELEDPPEPDEPPDAETGVDDDALEDALDDDAEELSDD